MDKAIGIEPSRTQPIALHKTRKGEAELGSYEGLDIVLVGNGAGGIGVHVRMVADHVSPIRFTFSFAIDQSYLPAVIQQIDAEFPPPISKVIAL